MFQRRRPPQLSVHDELRQTYADSCDLSIKNLTLEEQNKVEDALKGWKSLHTSLLYKLELFAKSMTKMNTEELDVFNELKSIRDQNVKHLIRVQLRVDELGRRKSASNGSVPTATTTNTSPNNSIVGNHKSMSVPSLRNGGIRSLNGTNKKKLLKSLRPQQQKLPSKQSQVQANTAANVSWQKPVPKVQVDDEFVDFDQDLEIEWDPIEKDDKEDDDFLEYYESDSQPNLIDLDTEYPSKSTENLNRNMYNFKLNGSQEALRQKYDQEPLRPNSQEATRPRYDSPEAFRPKFNNSMENLKPRFNTSTENLNKSRQSSMESNYMPKIEQTISNPIPEPKPKPVEKPKKYVYTKPKPMNINNLMKKTNSNNTNTIPNTKSSPKQTKPSAVQSKSTSAIPKAKKPNIQYNYVMKSPNTNTTKSPSGSSKPTPKKTAPQTNSPVRSLSITSSESETELDMSDLTNAKVQDQIISEIRGIDVASAKQIFNDIIVLGDEVYWEDIVGLDNAKSSLKEAVVYPFLRPDLFRGLREPTRGMLLFGPPGTGKTMLARAVATESKSIFFSITSSSITSKYLGESEKLVRALFLLAKRLSPSIVFIDEIDSLLGSRSEGEIESIRRIKNEFLIQWSELSSSTTKENEKDELKHQVLILGATNLPWSIDEAARRRFVKRQYIPLPEEETRYNQIKRLLKYQKHTLSEEDFDVIMKLTDKFSGSDITALCKDSAMGPLRSLGELLLSTPTEEIRAMNVEDFKSSLKFIKPSVSIESLGKYEDWAKKFGSSGV